MCENDGFSYMRSCCISLCKAVYTEYYSMALTSFTMVPSRVRSLSTHAELQFIRGDEGENTLRHTKLPRVRRHSIKLYSFHYTIR